MVFQWLICFIPSTIAALPSARARPDGPCTRSGVQRPVHGANAYVKDHYEGDDGIGSPLSAR